MTQPAYQGVKVLELGQGVAAPYCGMLLAMNGASVTKIEPPGGDWSRALGRQYGGFSADSIVLTRGKQSLALDMKHERGRAIALMLANEADVLIENYRPGVIERLGLDYGSLRRTNPSVIYVSLTGFGQTGPDRDKPATDTIMQAYAGLMSINRDGEGTPRRLDMLAIDFSTGLFLAQAVGAALYRRFRTGTGEHIETSLLACALALQESKMVEFALTGGESEVLGAPIGTFLASDGYISINARRQASFAALCRMLGKPEWITDPRFETEQRRIGYAALLNQLIAPILREHPKQYWVELLTKADILHAPIHDYDDLFRHPQVAATGAVAWSEVAGVGRVPVAAIPPFAGAARCHQPMPAVGQDGRAVLSELGLSAAEIGALAEQGVIKLPAEP